MGSGVSRSALLICSMLRSFSYGRLGFGLPFIFVGCSAQSVFVRITPFPNQKVAVVGAFGVNAGRCQLISSLAIIMKLTSALVLLLSLSAPIADARRATSSVASITRGGATKQSVAFHKDARVWGGDATVKEVRGGDGGGTSTMTSHLFNMVKAIVGVGVLSLPAG